MLSDPEFQTYCTKMASTPAWGGQVELQAMATVLKRPIEVRYWVGMGRNYSMCCRLYRRRDHPWLLVSNINRNHWS